VGMPSVFVGSSREGIEIARAVQAQLAEVSDVDVWNEIPSRLGKGTLESLVDVLDTYDFAVLVMTADDLIISRGAEQNAARDNVLIELGLFMGRIGRQRTFLLVPKETSVKIPSDLAGVIFATFAMPPDPRRLLSAVGPACTEIRSAIKDKSVIEQHLFNGLGIKLTSPVDRQLVPERFVVKGSYEVRPPEGFVVVVLERSPNSLLYYPKSEVSDFDENERNWQTASITLRGNPGDERILVAATMKTGNALCAYFHEVSKRLRDNLNNQALHIPGFARLTPDMIEHHRIKIKRSS
jgi:hypothetical protein